MYIYSYRVFSVPYLFALYAFLAVTKSRQYLLYKKALCKHPGDTLKVNVNDALPADIFCNIHLYKSVLSIILIQYLSTILNTQYLVVI